MVGIKKRKKPCFNISKQLKKLVIFAIFCISKYYRAKKKCQNYSVLNGLSQNGLSSIGRELTLLSIPIINNSFGLW